MSNQDKEKDYGNITDMLQFVFNQFLKDIFVSIPGIIETYDPVTKRCQVKPAINLRFTNGETEEQSSIINVPVVWPSAGGFTLIAPLQPGDAVEIKFSQRGITQFKETYNQADPGNGMFEKEDAHVVPGYGGLTIVPATTDGMSMQSEDGQNYVFVEDGRVVVSTPGAILLNAGVSISLVAPNINFTALNEIDMITPRLDLSSDLRLDGVIRGALAFGGARSDNHRHAQGNDSAGNTEQDTGVPQ